MAGFNGAEPQWSEYRRKLVGHEPGNINRDRRDSIDSRLNHTATAELLQLDLSSKQYIAIAMEPKGNPGRITQENGTGSDSSAVTRIDR